MPATTPPKGRPTAGRRDRMVASRRSRSRSNTRKFVWALLAVCVVGAILILGSGSGGNANVGNTGGTNTNLVLPALLALRLRGATLAPPRHPRS